MLAPASQVSASASAVTGQRAVIEIEHRGIAHAAIVGSVHARRKSLAAPIWRAGSTTWRTPPMTGTRRIGKDQPLPSSVDRPRSCQRCRRVSGCPQPFSPSFLSKWSPCTAIPSVCTLSTHCWRSQWPYSLPLVVAVGAAIRHQPTRSRASSVVSLLLAHPSSRGGSASSVLQAVWSTLKQVPQEPGR